ncbi:hypothetical protein PsYK624_105310 [Phanerochaete sordida]|uniref:F-box domain-containing protein n=1 Tax=Phanerochaete sordida TaxID=48140 RepID=A0A9P3LHP6_9APHY|nr:hypothetical protein PsYK624_105310 [Phanerochaete sordida]
MHPCLQVPEILRAIFDAISDREGAFHWLLEDERAAYAAAARTCKFFYEPAMDCLWAVVPSLSFVMSNLPRHLWQGTLPWYHDFQLLKQPSDGDWRRLIVNAKRVKYLSMHNPSPESPILETQLHALDNMLHLCTHPFPNLRRVSIAFDITPAAAEPLGRIFFSNPDLEEFSMPTCLSPLMPQILDSLAMYRPEIRNLDIFAWPAVQPATEPIARFTHLESLRTQTALLPEAWYHLSGQRTLQKLETALSLPYRLESIVRPSDAFPSLTCLVLSNIVDASVVAPLLHSISSRHLKTLELSFGTPELFIAASLNDIIEAIPRFPAITRLALRGPSTDLDSAELNATETPYSIRPLLRVRQLTWLVIRLGLLRQAFTDKTIPELAHAWPDLQVLSYEQSVFPITPSGLTLEALPLCAQHLPKLTQLTLDVDASAPPGPLPSPISNAPVSLDLTNSIIEHELCARVATYIASVYPRAQISTNSEPDASSETLFWTHAGTMIPVIAEMRAEIRRLSSSVDGHDVAMAG